MKTVHTMISLPESDVMTIREGSLLRIFFGFTPHVDLEGSNADLYDCTNVDLEGSSYSDIVNAIMVDKYPSDKVQAILLNYQDATDMGSDMTDNKRAEYIAEYNNLQAYRRYAKEIAHTVTD